ncbi:MULTISPECIES: hypothetical protein [Pseudanabaena]|jgi:hypothetical protein|uniref:hypothetical protein n=1 Tax=Pseudanabaena TaxID=1152 RepID=UPI002478F542|nr:MULTISPECIES: hypothetical protein [Pseudanabaena]MEA5487556.1 hypothetical protein [Pseudanabaena sp. CCNP1317]WGS73972.1 hypothetical protein OA858_08065 [Pseudanabaena galeata CCNP1313]
MNQFHKNYAERDADYYMHQVPVQILKKLDADERENLKSVIHTAIPRPSPKLIDLRFAIDLIFTRYFVVLMIGKDMRKQQRPHQVNGFAKVANVITAVLLIIAMSLLISSVTILILYLIKSALGIDFFPGHITNVLFKN